MSQSPDTCGTTAPDDVRSLSCCGRREALRAAGIVVVAGAGLTACGADADGVVDAAAFSLCMDNKLPMVVFGMEGDGNITRALLGERIGTLVSAS